MGSEYPFETLYFVQFTYRFFRLAGFFNWPDVRESEFQNPWNSCLCSVKSSKFVLRKSKSWSWNPEYSSGNPESDYRINDWNPESKFLWQRIQNPEPGIRNPLRGVQNPRLSWIPLYGAIQSTSSITGLIVSHLGFRSQKWPMWPVFNYKLLVIGQIIRAIEQPMIMKIERKNSSTQ